MSDDGYECDHNYGTPCDCRERWLASMGHRAASATTGERANRPPDPARPGGAPCIPAQAVVERLKARATNAIRNAEAYEAANKLHGEAFRLRIRAQAYADAAREVAEMAQGEKA